MEQSTYHNVTFKVVFNDKPLVQVQVGLRVFLSNTFSYHPTTHPPPGKVDKVQLGLPIENKSCLSMLVKFNNSVWDNQAQNKPDFRSSHKLQHP